MCETKGAKRERESESEREREIERVEGPSRGRKGHFKTAKKFKDNKTFKVAEIQFIFFYPAENALPCHYFDVFITLSNITLASLKT